MVASTRVNAKLKRKSLCFTNGGAIIIFSKFDGFMI